MPEIPDILITTYLEMTRRSAFRPAYLSDDAGFVVLQMALADVEFYRFLYTAVGSQWRWRDRLLMSDEALAGALDAPGTRVNVLYTDGVPVGYIELVRSGDDIEIAYFGLRPGYMGRGLGKHLLSWGIAQAWSEAPRRVWLHTCNLDGPYALDNYLKRGFSVYRIVEEPMPERYY
jgi:GNAT superfamily N-acetyltransferase